MIAKINILDFANHILVDIANMGMLIIKLNKKKIFYVYINILVINAILYIWNYAKTIKVDIVLMSIWY